MAKKIFIGNYKGGVGKTTSTYYIGALLRKKGEKVLLIDIDPQSSLSEICMSKMGVEAFVNLDDKETLNYIFDIKIQSKKVGQNNVKLDMDIENIVKDNDVVKFIPSSLLYKNGGLDTLITKLDNELSTLLILKEFLDEYNLDNLYDYIIFDCPPSNNLITQGAFLVSDYFLIPTIMDSVSTKGVKHYKHVINKLYDDYLDKNKHCEEFISSILGERPKEIGVFESRRKGSNTNTDKYRNIIKSENYLLETFIPDYKDITDKLSCGDLSNKSQYEDLVNEILNRL
ncbi:ParA family protein [Clostridium nigeriense]|uniref:ParA family protein n=1 Tax=Clostridium nigeriense TaxID=1805470 RepID=UPI003D354453